MTPKKIYERWEHEKAVDKLLKKLSDTKEHEDREKIRKKIYKHVGKINELMNDEL